MKRSVLPLLLALCGAVATSCGGEQAPAVKKVTLTANDQMQFNEKKITLKLGQTLEIDYRNIGKMPVEAMGHNLIILKPGTKVMEFGVAAVAAKETDYIPPDRTDDILAKSKLLGPGQSELVTFKPEKAGTYPYLCSFPGHVGTMQGTIVVKR